MFYLLLAAAGAAGTLARHALGGWVHGWAGLAFPWGTLLVNLCGSFLLGLAMRVGESLAAPTEVRGMVTIGFCGAFTTFSTFTLETVELLAQGAWARAALYAAGSLVLGLIALSLGLLVASAVQRTSA